MQTTRVRQLMQTRVVTVSVTERLSTVDDIMRLGGVRHMPVVHQGELVGVLSERDLLRASLSQIGSFDQETHRAFLHAVAIADVMSKPPITVGPEADVRSAARVMARRKIGCLPVVVDGALIGLLTETDLLGWISREKDAVEGRIPTSPD